MCRSFRDCVLISSYIEIKKYQMSYRYGNRVQMTFLPDSIEDYISTEDPVRVYDAFIDALDLAQLGIELDENALGNSAYDPVTMLKILVYGYSYGWRSSRKLERALHHNMSFIWLSGGLKPDHKTISNFRKTHIGTLKSVLTQCARMCVRLGLIEGNTLFVDGTKLRANAGKSETRSIEAWKKYQRAVEHNIEELIAESQKLDEQETESLVAINKELRNKEKLKVKIAELIKEVDNSDSPQQGQNKVNGTDPDCRLMKGRQGSHTGYNAQIVTDDSNGLIVSGDVTASNNDLNQLANQIKQADKVLQQPSKNVCADAGYSSLNDLVPLVRAGKTVVVPSNKQAQKSPKDNPFGPEAFRYHEDTDTYTCPTGRISQSGRYRESGNRFGYRMAASDCLSCRFFGICTTAKSGRRIYRPLNQKTKEKLEAIYESESGQQIYTRRKARVEHPFGHIKHNLGVNAFLLRGINGVKAEFSLLSTAFNLSRMITIMGGVKPLIEKMKLPISQKRLLASE